LAPRLGAEFVPQLDEGDLLVEGRKLAGISLTESVAIDQRVARRLREIAEIEHVVAKTGAPELATDAMGIEQTDYYLDLADRELWRAGLTKEALADEVAAALEAVTPDMAGAISQPIQMRTNELVAGVRSDVGILLYGPDLAVLERVANDLVVQLAAVPGVVDIQAERPAGLAYLRIVPDRPMLARWGLGVADINLVAETLAVGHPAGEVLEGDRRFDIVVKVDSGFAGDVRAIENIALRSAARRWVRLGDVADAELTRGPAMVNRSDQARRLIVQFNVRGRDLVSAVEDAELAVAEVDMPEGYHVEWGGTFAHYLDARDRLLVLVPIILVVILVLLWMALDSVGAALLIFIAIPFAATGGIAALWLRGIPFSISAGVGFIALAGVAVLNGLVLVTVAIRREQGGTPPLEAIRSAAEERLRPVLMTALVAALGFVPMAISTAPGSEVQRPLATVVIGGLVSATLLTLLVLPAVYAWIRRRP
jgi:cobalt-zinc-cadmium resistance protein CzcA